MAPVVSFRAAVAVLGRFPALAGVDLDVEQGEIVLVQGPNGAGKTSLLRACAGLLAVASGEAEVLGHDLRRDRRAVRRQVGLLGHATALYDDLTVEDNVRFAVRAAGGDTDAVGPALARLGLDGRLRDVAVGPAVGRPAPPHRHSPPWSPGGPGCGCSTSPTPASTPTAATCSTGWCARRWPPAPRCCSRRTRPTGPPPWPVAR